ncbi:hypothetical protein LB524_13955 [Mesorhizobium sp. ESP6-5]|uniref:hypothetical protein n=1 Tax=unclassified Mesorhizobium TaxID=325217 RepID=UPI0011281016|nr:MULTISPECIES: hypothetical protein [unclassified Mesorhizobium]MBZ9756396.1 hypothetical protein [Mesorhizobium sp. ESP6-5]MBZ9932165.1 hypothetical protein [Mesorhizobium sp. BR1-1-5]MBZ9684337.1 hypothetical protein [Mesorhizobium sp. CO1-1-2]MBZ9696353.1 hypothetical protein [Mesorhizobium sp. CO1-1-9]MBZ9906049.1 hypothetical protein [Mesorhizobium sp. BR115XR7A]
MKKLLLASVIAVASAMAVIAPANAASITLGIGNGYDDDYYVPRHRDYYRHYSDDSDYYGGYSDDGAYYRRHHYRYGVYDDGYRPRYYGMYHRRCHTELVKHWRHHHRVIERVRVCGY